MKESIHDIDCVFDGLDGRGTIYISSYEPACLKSVRQELNIRAVISVATGGYLSCRDELIAYLYIPAQDSATYEIARHFQETNSFLEEHRRNGNVLVHCMGGKSRSASIVVAYLLNKYRYSLPTVLTLLKRRRKKIDPNPGFMKQLEQYCDSIGVEKGDGATKSKSNSKSSRRQKSITHETVNGKNESKADKLTVDCDRGEEEGQKMSIASKIGLIRQKYMNSKEKSKLYSADAQVLSWSGSATLPTNGTKVGWNKVNSLQLS